MRFVPQTMLGRTIAIIFGCLILLQVIGGYMHYRQWHEMTETTEKSQLIERLTTYVQWINRATPIQREFLIRSNQASGMRVWLKPESQLRKDDDWFGYEPFIRDRLAESLGFEDKSRIRVQDQFFHRGSKSPNKYDDRKKKGRLFITVRLNDGMWLHLKVPFDPGRPYRFFPFLMPLAFLTVVIGLIALVIMKRATKPLARMAKAAEQLGLDVNAAPLKEEGPKEVKDAARAFNVMQTRLRRFVKDRTNMLAAISHDLRTPITRMRLRAEFVEDDAQREKMLADLDEMETMIKATMAFARDDVAHEAVQTIDLAALVETICEDMRELGGDVSYEGMEELSFKGRPVGLKRAVTNLINNALKYASACDVHLLQVKNEVIIRICDNGPGIPDEDLEDVFTPFRRVEGSRNKETGGVGLGLAVVRSVAHAHGGRCELANRPEGGLEARLVFPS